MDAVVEMPVYIFTGNSELLYLPRKDVKYGLVVVVNIPFVHPVSGMLSKSSKTVVETASQEETGMGVELLLMVRIELHKL